MKVSLFCCSISLIKGFLVVHKFHVFCLLEIYLITNIASNDDYLEFRGCNLQSWYYPSNTKDGGIKIYYRETTYH